MKLRRLRSEIALVLASVALVACTAGSSLGDAGADGGVSGGGCQGESFAPCLQDGGFDASDGAVLAKDSSVDGHIPAASCTAASNPVIATASCGSGGGVLSSYDAPQVCTRELHVVGVYEASSNHTSAAPSTVNVDFAGRGPIVLALSAYEAVSWTVTASAGTTIEAIVLTGYKKQTVMAPAGVRVNDYSGPTGTIHAYGYEYPQTPGGSDTQALLTALESTTGLPPASFHGCYQGTAFTLK